METYVGNLQFPFVLHVPVNEGMLPWVCVLCAGTPGEVCMYLCKYVCMMLASGCVCGERERDQESE